MKNKILISDYDGTLKTTEKNLLINIAAIKKFREQNNLFVLSTGRPYYSIIKEIEKYNIKYDYLTCQDGSLIFNQINELQYADIIKKEDSIDILYLLNNLKEVENYNINGIRNIVKKIEFEKIIEFEVMLKEKAKTKEFIELFKKVKENLAIYSLYDYIYIKNQTNKSDGIKKLLEINNLKDFKVITVGDGENDLEMLKDYEGYKIRKCHKTLKFKNIKTIEQVYKLI